MLESAAVKLADLFRDVGENRIIGDPQVEVSALSYRSDLAGPGHLFFCVPGLVHDGHDYAEDAVSRGASAICVESELPLAVPQVLVPSVRRVMGAVASSLYEHPSARLATVGITGTNGKTTSTYLTAFVLTDAGRRAGMLGTVERRIGGVSFPTERTTPEAVDVQQDLAMMVDVGDQAAVMEVSSHALDLGRVHGISFSAVAFTNLTQDHLDFHGDLESYFGAKSRLFLDPQFARNRPTAVINVADAFGRILAERLTPDRLLTFSARRPLSGEEEAKEPDAWGDRVDLSVRDLTMTGEGAQGTLVVRGRAADMVRRNEGRPLQRGEAIERPFSTLLVGDFNVSNILTSLGLGISLGLDLEAMLDSVSRFTGVPGRMERVEAGQPFSVLVDYAHTPDSVLNVLDAARAVSDGRLIGVLGCGGDRDRTKRPHMGRALEAGSDVAIITSDNPRSEEPEDIIRDVLRGLERPQEAIVEPDRMLAIRHAIREAERGDIVLILGKGHEGGQQFRDGTIPFDDRDVARECLAEMYGDAS